MVIVLKFGASFLLFIIYRFVTFTGNPHWPEIASALQPGQSYEHRADIVCRIFMDKATEFIKDITKRHVLGKVAAWCYSVEHQKRGGKLIFVGMETVTVY